MTPEQIKRHAEEVLRDKGSTAGAIYVADAYLAEHDETPVDEDWLRGQGFENTTAYGMQDDIFKYPIAESAGWKIEWGRNSKTLSIGAAIIGCTIKDNPTRGDVIRLLSVVGKGE